MLHKCILALSILCSAISFVSAQSFEKSFQKYGNMISDDAARTSLNFALTKIQTATCENKTPCRPATKEEFSHPPISIVDARAAMVFAINSALAQWCGLDFRRSFLPMIAFGKYKMKFSDRQLQLMTLIHGDFQGRQLASYQKKGACPPSFREQLNAELPKTPPKN